MDPKRMEYMDLEIMSDRDKADAHAAATPDVNCELTLRPPQNSSPLSIGRGPPSTASRTSRHTPNMHASHHPRRPRPPSSVPRSGGHGGAAAAATRYPYDVDVVRPTSRRRRNPTQSPGNGKSEIIPPPFPWAGNRRATVHSLEHLCAAGITEVSGDCQCKHCEARITIKLDLVTKFHDVALFMFQRMHLMRDRAPRKWTEPTLPGCESCGQANCLRPVIADKKRNINWLFLFLGQWLGTCTLEQVKYFCKHTKNHRTGAKDRVLFLSYRSLCMQLDPKLTFL